MPRGALPGYTWDARAGLYRRTAGGYVTRQEVIAGLREIARRSERLLGDIAWSVATNKLTLNDGVLAGAQFLKDLYNACSALARGGWSQMDFAAWGRNGQILRGEYAYWRNFMAAVARGELTEAEIRARAALYVGKAYSRFFAEERLQKLGDHDLTWEEWIVVLDERTCADCPRLAELGRVPLGTIQTVPGAGDTECLGACRCQIIYG